MSISIFETLRVCPSLDTNESDDIRMSPILYPTSSDILLQPVAAHLGFGSGLVLPSNSLVELKVISNGSAAISADGIFTSKLSKNDKILAKLSDNKVKFLRRSKSFNSYRNIMKFFGMNDSPN